ncbi:MAG: LysE family translocator [Parvularculaceae bacterium]|nr:LysE family translocator [Parvularculaceae bacterium]
MTPALYLGFVVASVLLIITPGPVVALVTATSLRWGAPRALWIVAGTAASCALHMVLVCFGLAAFLARIGGALFWLKWIGAAYLFYLGVRALLDRASLDGDGCSAASEKAPRRLFAEGFAVAFLNPKPLMFYAAFFPLFIVADAPAAPQLAVLAATFFAISVSLDTAWALAAARARPIFVRLGRWGNRLTGGVLIAAAAGLAAIRK